MIEPDWGERAARWLEADRREHAVEAEAAFGAVMHAMVRVEPAGDLEARIWRATSGVRFRLRAIRLLRLVGAAAAAASLAGATLYVASGVVVSLSVRLLSGLLTGLVRAFVWLTLAFSEGVDLWSFLGRAGQRISNAVFSSQAAAALVLVELLGALAFYVLNRVLAREKELSP